LVKRGSGPDQTPNPPKPPSENDFSRGMEEGEIIKEERKRGA